MKNPLNQPTLSVSTTGTCFIQKMRLFHARWIPIPSFSTTLRVGVFKNSRTGCGVARKPYIYLPRKVDIRLSGKVNSNSHGARPVHQSISMIKWIRTSRLSMKTSFSFCTFYLMPSPLVPAQEVGAEEEAELMLSPEQLAKVSGTHKTVRAYVRQLWHMQDS